MAASGTKAGSQAPRRRAARRAAIGLALAVGAAGAARAQEIIPFSEIKAGMKGSGRTVFGGTKIEEFQVEVLGTLEKIAPHRNLILVRLAGGPLATTGVMSGMSGSPVYLGGRLAGAVAYTWGFAKEPIAGVTPIQEMLRVEDQEQPAATRARAPLPPGGPRAVLALLKDPAGLPDHFAAYFSAGAEALPAASGLAPIATPLLLSGFSPAGVAAMQPLMKRTGLLPVQGGNAGKGTGDAGIVPGAGVGIKLVRGDVEMAAVCTVTYREEDRVMACGHPILNLGPTDMIMTAANVNGLMPSLMESFKFASTGDEVGAFRQDRSTGVFGYLGRRPRLIPVRVDLQPERGRARRYAFDIIEDSFLAPYLLYAALNGILSQEEKDYGEVTLSYKEGSAIQVAGEEDIVLRNLFSGDLASLYATGTVAFITQLLLNNDYHPVHINAINLALGYSDERRTARVERAWVNRDRVRAGESIQVSARIKPYRGPAVTRQIEMEVPDEIPPGRLLLQVGDGITLSRTEEEADEEFHPRDLAQLIWLINHLRSNDKVYAVLTRGDNGILFQGERLPNLPPSIAQVMVRPETRGNYLRLLYRGVAEETLDTEYAVSGFKQLSIEVEE